MTNLILVRHGESVWHHGNRYAGRSDVPLTDLGRRQAAHLGAWARTAGLDGLWCSPLSRARDTAAAVTAATGLEATLDERLRELDFGEAEGLTAGEMAERFPDRLEAFRVDPATDHLPGGEPPVDAARRALACFVDIEAAHPAGRVMVIGHTTLFRVALCHVLSIELSQYRRVFPQLRNAAITEIGLRGDQASLLMLNAPLPIHLDEPAVAPQAAEQEATR
jgi:broad specificity phosphatase PhoE